MLSSLRPVRAFAAVEQNESDANIDIDKEVSKFARNAATTFAPRASTATKNPAYKGRWSPV